MRPSSEAGDSWWAGLLRRSLLALILGLYSCPHLSAAECTGTPLDNLPVSIRAGQRLVIPVYTALDNDCNYKEVTEATLVCQLQNGRPIERRLRIATDEGTVIGEAFIPIPPDTTATYGECFIRFVQCNRASRTCEQRFDIEAAAARRDWRGDASGERRGRRPKPQSPSSRPRSRPREPSGSSRPPSRGRRAEPARAPNVGSGRGSGAVLVKGLGWAGIAVGLLAYSDAGAKEEEGRFDEADESEKLGNQAMTLGGLLLLLGHGMDRASLIDSATDLENRRFRPALAIDPVNRGFYASVSITF